MPCQIPGFCWKLEGGEGQEKPVDCATGGQSHDGAQAVAITRSTWIFAREYRRSGVITHHGGTTWAHCIHCGRAGSAPLEQRSARRATRRQARRLLSRERRLVLAGPGDLPDLRGHGDDVLVTRRRAVAGECPPPPARRPLRASSGVRPQKGSRPILAWKIGRDAHLPCNSGSATARHVCGSAHSSQAARLPVVAPRPSLTSSSVPSPSMATASPKDSPSGASSMVYAGPPVPSRSAAR